MKNFLPLLCAILAPLLSAYAGGGPAGCVVLYNPNDVTAVTLASRYQQVRGIPESNMIPYVFPASFTRTTAWDFMYSVRQTLAARGIDPQVQCVAVVGQTPPNSVQSSALYDATSLHSFIYLSPSYGQANFPATVYGSYNTALSISEANFQGPPPTGTQAIAADTPIKGKTFWPVSAPGYPGRSGLSPRENLAFIDRSKMHDAAKPNGTIYWPLNSDVRSTTRANQINDVAEVWRERGIKYWVSGDGVAFNVLASNRPDIAGGVIGQANPSVFNGNTYLPGTWIDHLTSNGGSVNSFNPGQTNATQWLRAGADGSSGTISEPLAYAAKFPHAAIQTHLRAGASLSESLWQSLQYAAELIVFGDPLLQPWADFPVVNVSAPADGSTVGGTIAITATASPTNGKTLEANFDLFIDGRRIAVGAPTEPVMVARVAGGFSLNTATLGDGWHELRVVAYNADAVRTQNEARFSVVVNNSGGSLTLTGPASVNPESTANFTATSAGFADLTSLSLQANGRTLATFPVGGGTMNVNLAAVATLAPLDGNWTLQAVGTRLNGQQVYSAPFTTLIAWPAMAATPSPSLGGKLADVRYFAATTAGGFDWDTTAPTVTTTTAGDATEGLFITPTNIPGITISNYATKPGYQLDWMFYAPTDDWYEIGFDLAPNGERYTEQRAAFIDGQPIAENNFMFAPRHLAPGWHSFRARMVVNNASWTSWKLRVRGGASQDFAAITPALAANTGTGNPSDSPTVTSITSTDPVIGTNVAVTANATIGGGTPGELATLTYHWTLVSGPEPVTFSANGTNAAKTTTVTFTSGGSYTLGLRVTGPSGSTISTRTVNVSKTPSATLVIDVGLFTNLLQGDSLMAYAYTKDQFSRRVEVTPINPALPTMQWSTNDPLGTIMPMSANGERISYRSLSNGGTFTLTATGVNGRAGTTSKTITIDPNDAPTPKNAQLFSITQTGGAGNPVKFTASVTDSDSSQGNYLTYVWTVVSTPAGQTLPLTTMAYNVSQGMPSGMGTYTVRLDVTDQAGAAITETQSFFVDVAGVATAAPFVGVPADQTALVGDTAFFFAAASSGGTLQWQSSADSGATWQNVSGANSTSLDFGPVTAADAGKQFRLVVTNAAGMATSSAATLTVTTAAAGVIGFTGSDITVPETVGTVQVKVHRAGGSTGAVSARVTLYEDDATLTSDYKGFNGATQTVITLNWANGDSSDRILNLPIVNDSVAEQTEDFFLEIDNVTGGALLSSYPDYYVIITDDDGPGTVAMVSAAASAYENDGNAVITARRSDSFAGSITVTYATANGTAVAPQDYIATSGSLTWANGDSADKQILVPLVNDGTPEGEENFSITLSGSSVGIFSIKKTTVTLKDAPYQQWQQTYWPGSFPAVAPIFNQTVDAIGSYSPLFLYRFSETSGSTVSGVDATGAILTTGTLATSGAGTWQLNQTGPRPPAWPGFESTNAAIAMTASGSAVTPPQYNVGAYVKAGGANGLASKLKSGFTFSAFVKTPVTDRVMYLLGATGTNGAQFSVILNRDFTNATTTVPHSLRLYMRSDAGHILDYSVVLSGQPTGSLCDGQWHHIAITQPSFTTSDNANFPRFFFDGVEANALNVRGTEAIDSGENFTEFFTATTMVRFGSTGTASVAGFFAGAFDELAFVSRVLTPTEIARISTAGPLTPPPAAAALTADGDFDGSINLLEYFLGTNPLLSTAAPISESFVQIGVNSYLAITYTENVNATDVSKAVEVSSDLATWSSGPSFTTVVSSNVVGTTRTLTVRDNLPTSSITAPPTRFIRVKVSSVP